MDVCGVASMCFFRIKNCVSGWKNLGFGCYKQEFRIWKGDHVRIHGVGERKILTGEEMSFEEMESTLSKGF